MFLSWFNILEIIDLVGRHPKVTSEDPALYFGSPGSRTSHFFVSFQSFPGAKKPRIFNTRPQWNFIPRKLSLEKKLD